jgi:hypothetical protein
LQTTHLSLILKFLTAGTLVVAATWFAVRGKTVIAALVGVFPFITFLTVLFTYLESKDVDHIADLAKYFGFMLLATAIFPLGLHQLLKRNFSLGGNRDISGWHAAYLFRAFVTESSPKFALISGKDGFILK